MKMTQRPIILSFNTLLLTTLFGCKFITTNVSAQQYLDMKQDAHIYDVDVVVFARRLSQPTTELINNKASVKGEDVLVLQPWDGEQSLLQYPQATELPNNTVPIENQAKPVKVLSNVILSTSMNHPIINRLVANPTFKPIYRQKWRQAPSAFLKPQYIEVSTLPVNTQNQGHSVNSQTLNNNYSNQSNFVIHDKLADYTIDGQVAFSSQRYMHLHVKMNLFRINIDGQKVVYELSQQKRIDLDQWQYFDHQQFGILAKVTAVKLNEGE